MSEEMAQKAYDIANETRLKLQGHEDTCAERYKNIADKHDEVRGAIDKLARSVDRRIGSLDGFKWALVTGAITLLGVGFLYVLLNGSPLVQ